MQLWPLRLNIRQKIIIGLAFVYLTILLVGGLSYFLLTEMKRKAEFVSICDDLNNSILEMRRFEKNFFLYGSTSSLEKISEYIDESVKLIDTMLPRLKGLKGSNKLLQIRQELQGYRDVVQAIKESVAKKDLERLHALQDELRDAGKKITGEVEELTRYERERIHAIIDSLRYQLITVLFIVLIAGALFIPLVSRKIVRPLRVIEKSMLRIAGGDFKPLPVMQTYDETQKVVEAFNKMVAELERRQEQLVQAKKLSSLGILTSGIAHQLNNPLNNISTSCQILLEDMDNMDPELVKKMISNVDHEVGRARDIVKGLLEFSRVREFSLVPTRLKDVVDKTRRLVSSQIPSWVDVEIDVPEEIVVEIDSPRMQQVFLNLFMNSIHAIGNDAGKITVRARATGEKVVIEFEDTGCGIPKEHLDKIFDPFFTTKEVGAGTGLGLSIVYGIIEKHSGEIGVESEPGKGTKFIITLPIRRDHGEQEEELQDVANTGGRG
ncbi:ATP-binding protein [Thermodesulforhabdus norvegica]|uniref:histidine kinase n=1 Tax=Thermodesulforhabdus norvegica TaxID=39841 RepID=A0A1I4UP42_9BACT|nr:ATP-binding protein [Thermodesulforhabdus norvegica]SFM90736.1 Signal transduction histidine kinase [Thermodesulforhabdus norvegica]